MSPEQNTSVSSMWRASNHHRVLKTRVFLAISDLLPSAIFHKCTALVKLLSQDAALAVLFVANALPSNAQMIYVSASFKSLLNCYIKHPAILTRLSEAPRTLLFSDGFHFFF